MTYFICSDNIDGKEQSYINAVISELKAKGKDAVSGGVGPNKEALRNSKSSGDTVVFIVGGGAAGCTLASFVKTAEGLGDCAYTIFAYAGWTSNPYVHCDRIATDKLVKEHDCNFYQSWMPSYYEGHTLKTFCDKYSKYVGVCCSSESASDLGKKIANGDCGVDGGDDDGESSASTIKDALKELLSYWDGDVECYVRGDTVYVNKVPVPEESCTLKLKQGVNIKADSVNISDYKPDTVNVLTVHSEVMDDIVYRNEKLINRFGEKPAEMDAVKIITKTETTSENTDSTEDNTSNNTNINDDTEDNASDNDGSVVGDSAESTTETKTTTKTEEVPCETPEEVEAFANREWNKIKRNDGHSIELGVVGSPYWKVGEWVWVNIPLFDEELYMYINKVSQSESDAWDCNLTLVDYPPSLGEYNEEETEDDEDAEDTSEETDDSTSSDTGGE